MQSWREVPVIACDEPMEVVAGVRIHQLSAYHERGYKEALPEVWLRTTVASAVARAAGMLPPGVTLLLWDGWRPLALQVRLYEQYRREIHERTGLTGDQLDRETQRFVAEPSSDPDRPSPHLTGGAIDLTLADEDGHPLDMGGAYDELGDRSGTTFYEREELSEDERQFRNRRRLLCAVMTHVGFSNYREEWWHFDMGNQFHHFRTGGCARYGLVSELPRAGRVPKIEVVRVKPRGTLVEGRSEGAIV